MISNRNLMLLNVTNDAFVNMIKYFNFYELIKQNKFDSLE